MRLIWVLLAVILVMAVAGCGKKDNLLTPEDCNKLLDRKLRSDCIYNMSLQNRNPTFCKDIPDMAIRARCIDEISILLDNEAYCQSNDRLSVREECERKVAVARKARKDNATKAT